MVDALKSLGLTAILFFAFAYLLYMIGLSFVFKQLNFPTWQAFIPLYNYYVLIQAVGLPKRWFGLAIVPYAGAVYALAISIRLGKIYHRGIAFSSTWLTFAAPIGMFVIALSKQKRDMSVIKEAPPAIDTRQLQNKIKRRRPKNETTS